MPEPCQNRSIRMKQAYLLCLCGLLAAAFGTSQTAPAHTDFSGRWRMIKSQSDFGKFSHPDLVVRVIDQQGPTLNLHTVETTNGKTTTSDISYFTDGQVSTNNRSGREATSKAFWDGADLVIRTDTTDSRSVPIQIVERWQLSPDRQVLVTTSDIPTATGSAQFKLVCQREAAK